MEELRIDLAGILFKPGDHLGPVASYACCVGYVMAASLAARSTGTSNNQANELHLHLAFIASLLQSLQFASFAKKKFYFFVFILFLVFLYFIAWDCIFLFFLFSLPKHTYICEK